MQKYSSSEWALEIAHHAPNVPTIVVGTKLDLREDPDTIERLRQKRMSPISYSQGVQMARDIRAARFVACMILSIFTHLLDTLSVLL